MQLNDDSAAAEHGFVELFAWNGAIGAFWLDGRQLAEWSFDEPDKLLGTSLRVAAARLLRQRRRARDRRRARLRLLPARSSDDELRAPSSRIATGRPRRSATSSCAATSDGAWQDAVAAGADGWHIEGCPVNGPAIAAAGERVAVAWFTAAGDAPRVRFARVDRRRRELRAGARSRRRGLVRPSRPRARRRRHGEGRRGGAPRRAAARISCCAPWRSTARSASRACSRTARRRSPSTCRRSSPSATTCSSRGRASTTTRPCTLLLVQGTPAPANTALRGLTAAAFRRKIRAMKNQRLEPRHWWASPRSRSPAHRRAARRISALPPAATELHPGLGDYHFPITTANADAQVYFDHGIRLLYGFNHDEAARYFRRAAELDPQAPMPYWGVALSIGPNYNDAAVDAARAQATYDAVKNAEQRAANASARERDYIAALGEALSVAGAGIGLARLPSRLQRSDARDGREVSRRRRRGDDVRREPHDAAPVAALEPRRRAGARHARARRGARVGAEARSRTIPARTTSTSTRSRRRAISSARSRARCAS